MILGGKSYDISIYIMLLFLQNLEYNHDEVQHIADNLHMTRG